MREGAFEGVVKLVTDRRRVFRGSGEADALELGGEIRRFFSGGIRIPSFSLSLSISIRPKGDAFLSPGEAVWNNYKCQEDHENAYIVNKMSIPSGYPSKNEMLMRPSLISWIFRIYTRFPLRNSLFLCFAYPGMLVVSLVRDEPVIKDLPGLVISFIALSSTSPDIVKLVVLGN